MQKQTWLRRMFDPRLKHSVSLPAGVLFILLLGDAIRLPAPTLTREEGRWITLALALAVVVAVCLRLGKERNRKHSVVRGSGWFPLGVLAGALALAVFRLGKGVGYGLLFVAVSRLALAYAAWAEWSDRELTEE